MIVLKTDTRRGNFRHALFDFDGTISLLRAGWQDVMKPYFVEVLKSTPDAEPEAGIAQCVHDFVDLTTGKQTIYQCIELAGQVAKRNGRPLEPLAYKQEYNRRLMSKIRHRIDGVADGSLPASDFIVPGAYALLEALRQRGVTLYLASGTDEDYVRHEAELIRVSEYFNGGIWGARDDYKRSSKRAVIQSIMSAHRLSGSELLGFGDGYVEIENVKEVSGYAVGVASDEHGGAAMDEWKRERLTRAGADLLIPDYTDTAGLMQYLFDA
jgi:phosphoglycolate phosphatase-like HAD superfamily hydrolase